MYKKLHAIILIATLLSCQEEVPKFESIKFTNNYPFNNELHQQVKSETSASKHQFAAAKFAKKGAYRLALEQWDLGMPYRSIEYNAQEIDSIQNNFSRIDAKELIISSAKEHRITIINEAHHNSAHRLFTRSLLEGLYKQGYRQLGIEALVPDENDPELHKRKYAVQGSGYYTSDPQFGNLIREALELGFTLFSYDTFDYGGGRPREIAQAEAIQEVMKNNPNDKVLIHGGFEHAMEGKHKTWELAMAGRIREFTGFDPLTIDQTIYSEKSNPDYNHPLLKAAKVNQPTVLVNASSNPIGYQRGASYMDIAVLHPTTSYVGARPDWLFKADYKKSILSLEGLELNFPLMILAFRSNEDIKNAVPVDIVEYESRIEIAQLALLQGHYKIILTDGNSSLMTHIQVE